MISTCLVIDQIIFVRGTVNKHTESTFLNGFRGDKVTERRIRHWNGTHGQWIWNIINQNVRNTVLLLAFHTYCVHMYIQPCNVRCTYYLMLSHLTMILSFQSLVLGYQEEPVRIIAKSNRPGIPYICQWISGAFRPTRRRRKMDTPIPCY